MNEKRQATDANTKTGDVSEWSDEDFEATFIRTPQQAIMNMLETMRKGYQHTEDKNRSTPAAPHTHWARIAARIQPPILFSSLEGPSLRAASFENQGSSSMVLKLRCPSEPPGKPDKGRDPGPRPLKQAWGSVFLLVSSDSDRHQVSELLLYQRNLVNFWPKKFLGDSPHLRTLQNSWPEWGKSCI